MGKNRKKKPQQRNKNWVALHLKHFRACFFFSSVLGKRSKDKSCFFFNWVKLILIKSTDILKVHVPFFYLKNDSCAKLTVAGFLCRSSLEGSCDRVLLILSNKTILKSWTDGMLPVHGAFTPHGWSGKEPKILQPRTKSKHLFIMLHIDQFDSCPVNSHE